MKIICDCGLVNELKKKGLTVCKCGAVLSGAIRKKEGKRDFHKRAARSNYTLGDQVYLLGWIFMIVSVFSLGFGVHNIWNNGFSAFKMESFALIVMVGFIGFAMTGGMKKSRKV